MTKVKIYSYKNCDTCRKAVKFLAAKKNLSVEELDITTVPPTPVELKAMLAQYQGEVRKLFNTSGVVYKEMKLSASLKSMEETEALKLLASNGRLVKRPFLLVDGQAKAVGFKEEEWKSFL